MRFEKLLKVVLIVLVGILFGNMLNFYLVYGVENPFSSEFLFYGSPNVVAPSDIVSEKQIEILDDKIIINLEGASLSRYAATGSMRPVLDKGANGIRIKPKSPEEINVGDIITFREYSKLIVHRVIEKGEDSEGIYFITKGDNNNIVDGKLRFEDIKYITIGVIW